VRDNLFEEKKMYCGKVINKFPSPIFHKNNVTGYENIIIVNFDEVGVQNVSVTDNTFYSTNINERVCFNFKPSKFTGQNFSFLPKLSFIIVTIESFLLVIYLISLFFERVVPWINNQIDNS